MTETLETIERARGHLYSFHHPTRHAGLQLDAAETQLRDIGHADPAQHISSELIGRNVLPQRWSFQVIEETDGDDYRCFKEIDRLVRNRLTGGRPGAHRFPQ